jgi:flagellar biogenesis protein FliO
MSVLFLPDANMSIVLVVLGFIILFIFFVYMLVRRTAQGFKEGMEGGRQ